MQLRPNLAIKWISWWCLAVFHQARENRMGTVLLKRYQLVDIAIQEHNGNSDNLACITHQDFNGTVFDRYKSILCRLFKLSTLSGA